MAIYLDGKKYKNIKVGVNPLDVTINDELIAENTTGNVDLTLIDKHNQNIEFTNIGNEIKVDVESWMRPSDWLPIPNPTLGVSEFYALYALFEGITNYVTIASTPGNTVFWGDGTSVATNGTYQEKIYDYNTITSPISVNEFGQNYKQVLVRVLINTSNTTFRIDRNGFNPILLNKPSGILECKVYGGNMTTFDFGFNRFQPYLENIDLSNSSNILPWNNTTNTFNRNSLKSIKIDQNSTSSLSEIMRNNNGIVNFGDLISNTTSTQYAFYSSKIKRVGNITLPNATSMLQMFQLTYFLKEVGNINTPNVTVVTGMFRDAQQLINLGNITLSNSITNLGDMFLFCYCLRRIVFTSSLANVTSATNFVGLNYNLQEVILPGFRLGFNISNSQMSATALNNMFTSLGTASGSQTITVTGNPGAATCNPTIATAKGFTVVL